jgi:hypothetical protein
MSYGMTTLHSHSALERLLNYPKHIVIIDENYSYLFDRESVSLKPFKYNGVVYLQCPIMDFVKVGGVFKNLLR